MNHSEQHPNPYESPNVLSAEAGALPAAEVISSPATMVRYLVLLALCAAAIIAYVQRNSIAVAEEPMRLQLGLTKEQMGWGFSAFFLAYALLQIPSGLFGQFVGSRRGLSIVMGLSSLVSLAMAGAVTLPLLLASRLGMGAAQAGVFPCSIPTLRQWIPEARRSLATGMLGSSMSIGGAVGGALMGLLLPLIGWQAAFALFALPGFAFAILFYTWFRETPDEHPAVNEAERALIHRSVVGEAAKMHGGAAGDVIAGSGKVVSGGLFAWGRTLLAISALCGQQVLRAAGQMFFASWFATFLRETRGVGDVEVGVLSSLPWIAIVIGSPTGGLIGDWLTARTGSRRVGRQGVAAVGMLACGLLVLAVFTVTSAWLAVLTIAAGSFFAAFGGPSAYAATIDMGGRHAPTVFSTMNMMGNFGAALFPVAVPLLLAIGVPSGESNWNLVLWVFAGMYFAAALCWLLADANVSVERLLPPREKS